MSAATRDAMAADLILDALSSELGARSEAGFARGLLDAVQLDLAAAAVCAEHAPCQQRGFGLLGQNSDSVRKLQGAGSATALSRSDAEAVARGVRRSLQEQV